MPQQTRTDITSTTNGQYRDRKINVTATVNGGHSDRHRSQQLPSQTINRPQTDDTATANGYNSDCKSTLSDDVPPAPRGTSYVKKLRYIDHQRTLQLPQTDAKATANRRYSDRQRTLQRLPTDANATVSGRHSDRELTPQRPSPETTVIGNGSHSDPSASTDLYRLRNTVLR